MITVTIEYVYWGQRNSPKDPFERHTEAITCDSFLIKDGFLLLEIGDWVEARLITARVIDLREIRQFVVDKGHD